MEKAEEMGSMGGTRALSMSTIVVLEGTERELRWSRRWEGGWPDPRGRAVR
jgi:hypothetical protein